MTDNVNHPQHYTNHPSGIEAIQVTEHLGFCVGNAIKYLWRADLKNDALEDLRKARWYVDREIARREAQAEPKPAKPAPPKRILPGDVVRVNKNAITASHAGRVGVVRSRELMTVSVELNAIPSLNISSETASFLLCDLTHEPAPYSHDQETA